MILLRPGPVNVSERVRQALPSGHLPSSPNFPTCCSAFSKAAHRLQTRCGIRVRGCHFNGVRTAAVESAVMSCLRWASAYWCSNNGVYGERLSNMIGLQRLEVRTQIEWRQADPERSGWPFASIPKCMRYRWSIMRRRPV